MARTLLLSALALLLVTLAPGPGRGADEDDPDFNGRKLSEYLQLLKKLQTDKPADDKEADRAVEKRRVILDVLELIGPKPKPVVPAVHRTLKEDPSERIRAYAARWLGRTAVKAKEADVNPGPTVDALVDAARTDKAAAVRTAAAGALSELARTDVDLRGAVPGLTAALHDPDAGTRAAAAQALGRIGPDAQPAVPDLVAALKDKK